MNSACFHDSNHSCEKHCEFQWVVSHLPGFPLANYPMGGRHCHVTVTLLAEPVKMIVSAQSLCGMITPTCFDCPGASIPPGGSKVMPGGRSALLGGHLRPAVCDVLVSVTKQA